MKNTVRVLFSFLPEAVACTSLPRLALHTDSKQVAKADLGDIVGNVLVVLEVGSLDFGVSRSGTDVRLDMGEETRG